MKVAAVILVLTLMFIIFFIVTPAVFMFVWNTLAHYFGFRIINYWIALAITILLSIVGNFFKSRK